MGKKVVFLAGDSGWKLFAMQGDDSVAALTAIRNAGHRFSVSKVDVRGKPTYFAVQGTSPATAMIRSGLALERYGYRSGGTWSSSRRFLVPDASGACSRCHLHSEKMCSGNGAMIPDARSPEIRAPYGETAVQAMMRSTAESMWEECLMTTDADADAVTVTEKFLSGLGFLVVKNLTALANPNVTHNVVEETRRMLDSGVDVETADIAKVVGDHGQIFAGWSSNPTAFGKKPVISSMVFSEELVVINRARARERSWRGAQTRASRDEFRKRECSACAYGCEDVPYNHKSIGRCWVTAESLTKGASPVSDGEVRLIYAHSLAGMKKKDWRLSGKRARKGIVFGPEKLNTGMLRVVSLVTPYPDIGSVSVKDIGGLQSVDEWFAGFCKQNPKIDMRIVAWALGKVQSHLHHSRSMYWHGNGRRSRNTVLAVRLDSDCTISVLTDTLAHSWRGSGASIESDERPRFSFRLRYPYFVDFRQQMDIYPGSGRG